MRNEGTSVGIKEVVFNSGQTVRMADDDSLQGELVYGMQFDKTQLSAPNPCNLVDYETVDGGYGLLDSNAIEFLISSVTGEQEYVELHFSSGKKITVLADSLDAGDDIAEDDIYNVLLDFIYRHNTKNPLKDSGK